MARHVVLIMTDQQRADTLAAFGGRCGTAPSLDALAAECTVMERSYCTTPLCVPTRTALYTGLLPHESGVVVNGWTDTENPFSLLPVATPTLYEHLAAHGYGITHVGTDHVKSDAPIYERVPEMTYVGSRQHGEYLASRGMERPDLSFTRAPCLDYDDGQPICVDFTTPRTGVWPYAPEHFLDCFYAGEAERIISELDTGTPQFIEVLFWAPHVPLVAPEPYYSMFDRQSIELPETTGVWDPAKPATHLMHIPGKFGTMYLREEWREPWAVYLGLVRLVDDCIGRVIRALKTRGIWEDALVIFTPDHGEMLGSHAMFQKMCMYEEAVHLPLLIKPPGGRNVERCGALTGQIDLNPTICEYAGVPLMGGNYPRSMKPLLEGAPAHDRDFVFMEFNGNSGRAFEQRAIVRDRWKYIYTKNDVDELYDLQNDPAEITNLVPGGEYENIRRELRCELGDFMAKTSDRIAL
ncbi:MAG: sulfatase-like hydrolase/transferase [Planctomycetes bacterium]|nr:sulfatase-like hydrolase/transferase [Planctomycetota bacterium]